MKSMTPWLVLALATACAAGTHAAEAAKATVIRDYTDTVAPADQLAYEAGIKRFNECLSQHGFKYTWTAWTHETGDTYTYSYTTDPLPWSGFDAMQAAGKACDGALRSEVNPHLKSEFSAFMETQPDMSHMAKGMGISAPYIEVIYFKLKFGHENREAFTTVVKKIAAAAEKSKWPYYFATASVRGGGGDAPDYVVVLPSKSWADLGMDDNPPLWTMVENAYGKEEAQAMRKSLNDAVQSQASHVDSYNAELSYKASGK
ncbi:hypothetical protein ACXU4B_10100 [Dyella soli]|uniref:Uncharacterized protein n=1 Tax=Dyella soli TaxID=522319 RepID=A0A4R0YQM7_9GAMM|nr:hypothetical protein [Dyella soli]TCI11279.1 hypothetical protein EZM97_20990 [Dyella soli]